MRGGGGRIKEVGDGAEVCVIISLRQRGGGGDNRNPSMYCDLFLYRVIVESLGKARRVTSTWRVERGNEGRGREHSPSAYAILPESPITFNQQRPH